MNIKWNAGEYKDNFQFVHKYGEGLFSLLPQDKDLKIIDLGCGNGALTAKLAEIYGPGNVTGIDASAEMLETARESYPELNFIRADAAALRLPEPVDVIFSNAVFHWIDDQDALLESVASSLRPGGTLVCEFGGYGCCESIHAALEEDFEKRGLHYKRTFYFPTIGQYAPILERHGLRVTFATLFDRFTELSGDDGVRDWINMFNLTPFEGIAEDVKDDIIKEATAKLKDSLYKNGRWHADYVRIRIKAIRV